MKFSSHSQDEALLDPNTIIAVSEDEHGLHADPYGVPSGPTGLVPPRIDGLAVGEPRAAPRTGGVSRFKIRLANSEGRRSSASYLIQKMYGWRGYKTNGSVPYAPNRITLVASDDERAIATISVGFDSPAGLLADELYGDEVGRLRAAGRSVCEFTKLAVDRNDQSREVLAMMFHIAYMYARRLNGCTDLLIEVNPRHVRFYRAMLGFEILGAERTCPRVNAPAVLLLLDLHYAQEQIARYGGHRELAGQVRSLYPLGFSAQEEIGICGRLHALA